jgi:cellulose synthase/poly-beta-1,6-N-acetylglucosamine synthase-like glycosyltransferase
VLGLVKVFLLVLARDDNYVDIKTEELKKLGLPYLIVCGKKIDKTGVIYREPYGKYDAINFGFSFVPKDTEILVLNDVDTKIHNFDAALRVFDDDKVALVFGSIALREGPQVFFYKMLDAIRRLIPVTASGELMFIKRDIMEGILPLKPCKAEDSYILFKVSELKHDIVFCKKCYAETERTKIIENEELYKRKTVCGLYQALSYTRPSRSIRLFFLLLPFASPLLLVLGKKGYFWMKGILLGLTDYLSGDRSGTWQQIYMK